MAHIGLICLPLSGHVNPMATLGRAIARRGHRVTMFQIPAMRERVAKEQLEFQPLGANPSHTTQLTEHTSGLARRTGLSALRFSLNAASGFASLICEHAPAAISAAGVDLIVSDQIIWAAGSVAQHLRIPFVNLAAIPMQQEPFIPPAVVSWPYRRGWPFAFRNYLADKALSCLAAPAMKVISRYRREWKLDPNPELGVYSPYAQLTQLVKELDFPRSNLPNHVHYIGSLIDHRRPPIAFPFDRIDGRPLIYASFGTMQNNRPEFFETVAKACDSINGQLVLTTGGNPIEINNLPPSAIKVDNAPQLDLLARAALCITHSGLNTVMECLQYGVPMVCMPVTGDQPAVAARVQWAGAGVMVPLRKLTAKQLHRAIEHVLNETAFRESAQRLARAVKSAGGAERGADIILQVLNDTGRSGRPDQPL